MNLNKGFPTEPEKKNAAHILALLKNYPGWRFLVEKFLEPDVDRIGKEILDLPVNDESREQEKELKRKRAYFIILSQLPEKLIEALEGGKEDLPEFDPYYMDIKEMDEKP